MKGPLTPDERDDEIPLGVMLGIRTAEAEANPHRSSPAFRCYVNGLVREILEGAGLIANTEGAAA